MKQPCNQSALSRRIRAGSVRLIAAISTAVLYASIPTGRAQPDTNLDHFFWSGVPLTVQATTPFFVTVQSQSSGNTSDTNFNGSVTVSELVPTSGSSVLITEIQAINTNRVELSNLSTNSLDLSGWRVVFYDSSSWPAPKTTFTLPSGTICPPFGTLEIRGSGSFPGLFPVFYTGLTISWSSFSGNPIAVLLLDPNNQPVDFFCTGTAYPQYIGIPQTLSTAVWSGPPVRFTSSFNPSLTYQRRGHEDHHNAGDWIFTTNSFGIMNPGMAAPFVTTASGFPAVPASVILTNGVWSGQLIVNVPGTNVFLRADNGQGFPGDSGPFTVTSLAALNLVVPPAAFKATPGLVGQGEVSISNSLSNNLDVTLSVDLTNEILIPSTVTILTGTTNAFFAVSNLNNGLPEGPQTATIQASAPGFSPATDWITNYDALPETISVSAPGTVSETSGWVTSGQINLSAPAVANVAVQLSSSNPGRLLVPDFVVIPAGQTSVKFGFTVLDNLLIDGNQPIIISGFVPGWTSGQTQVVVIDNENTNLSLSLPSSVNEGAGVLTNAGSVQIHGILMSNLTVVLTSSLPAKIQFPASVVIPAGQSSALFNVTIPDDSLTDGNQSALATASANGFARASQTVTVIDNDVFSFTFATLPSSQIAGQSFPVTISALNLSGTVVPGFSGTASLTASGMSGNATVSPAVVGPFTNGIWSGMVSLPGANHGLVLSVDDGLGHTGSSAAFDVVAAKIISLAVADLAYDALRDRLLAGAITNASGTGQSVIPVDPASGNMGIPIPIGNDPSVLAISDDFQYLYVSQAMNSTGGVARVNLSSQSVDLRFPVGTVNQYGQSLNYVDNMKVQPGHPHTLAATTTIQYSAYNQYIAVYDDGVQRSNVMAPAVYVTPFHIVFGDSASYFYVAKPGGIWIDSITPGGVQFLQEVAGSQYGADMVFASGHLYSNLGQVFDTNGFTLVGSFPASGPTIPDLANGRVYFLTQSGAQTSFRAFDANTYTLLGSLTLPNVSGQPYSFVPCGLNRFAFRTTANQLVLFDTSVLYTNSLSDLSLALSATPTQPLVGSNLAYSITVSNAGPATSYGVTFTNQIPPSAAFVSASSTMGQCSYAAGIVSCALGLMTNGASAEITITVQPTIAGLQLDGCSVSALTSDLDQTNNYLTDVRAAALAPGSPALAQFCFPSGDIVFDPATQLIWASVPPGPFGYSNCIVSIDPQTGNIGNPVQVGRQPDKLAVARTGQNLYVGLDEDYTVQRYDTLLHQLDQPFSIGTYNIAYSMDVRPGAPQTVAVSRYSPIGQDYQNVALYDTGVARPATVQSPGIEFSSDGSVLYGFGWDGYTLPNTSGDAFFVNAISSSGLSKMAVWAPHYFLNIVSFDVANGIAYLANGYTLDATSLAFIGQFNGIGYSPLVRVGNTNNVVFFLSNNGSNWMLQEFDRTSFLLVGSLTIPGVLGNPSSLINWGSDGMAFRTSSNQIFFIHISQIPPVPPPAPVPQLGVSQVVSPAVGSVGSNSSYTIIVTNPGPVDAQSVVVADTLPRSATVASANTPQGSVSQTQGGVNYNVGTISAGSSVTLSLTISPGLAGLSLNSIAVSAGGLTLTNSQSTSAVYQWIMFGSGMQVTNEINLPVSDLACDISNRIIYAAVVDSGGPLGNHVVGIDLTTGALGLSVPLDATPGLMASSDDGAYLYVAQNSVGGIARVDTHAGIVDLNFPLGTPADAPIGGWVVEDLSVMPGAAHTVAVARGGGYAGYNSGVAIYDDGVKRPASVDTTYSVTYYRLEFSDPTNLYATSAAGFQILQVGPAGVSNTPPVTNRYAGDFAVDHGLAYTTLGEVFNPITVSQVGMYPLPGPGVPAPDTANDRVYYLMTGGNGYWNWWMALRAFDPNTYTELWTIIFPPVTGYGQRLLKLGTDGLAISTDANRFFLVHTPLLSSLPTDLSLSQSVSRNLVNPATPITYSISVANAGFCTATSVIVSNPVPSGVSFVSATALQGTVNFTNGLLLCSLGSLVSGASATVTLNVVANSVGQITNTATVTQAAPDTNPTNNSAMTVVTVSPQPGVTVGDTTVTQGTSLTTITFPLTLSAPSTAPISVGYQTADGTAIAGQNYNAVSGVVTFSPGTTSRQLSLSIIRNNPSMAAQSYFFLNLTTVTNAVFARAQAVGTIVQQIFYSLAVGNVAVENRGSDTNALFSITAPFASSTPMSVQYQTVDGTAAAPLDYLPRAGTLTFNPGVTNLTLNVPVRGNATINASKAFTLLLSQPENAILGVNEATATIIDDALIGAVAISGVQLQGNNILIQFNSISGRFYRLERTDNLASGSWTVAADQIPGTGNIQSVSDPIPTQTSTRFYRLVLLP